MGEHPRLLMVGVDHQALEAIRTGEAGNDVDVTVLMGGQVKDIGLPLPRDVKVVFVDDAASIDACMNALFRCGQTVFDAIYALDDQAMMTAAALGCVLGARSLPARTVCLFRDKYLQKRVLRQAGVVVARHELIPDIHDLSPSYRLSFDKAVLKPVAGQATESTYLVHSTEDVRSIGQDRKARGLRTRTFVVEEFIEGEEWFVDGVVSGGLVRFASLGRYGKTCLEAVSDSSPVRTFCLDPVTDKVGYEAAMPVVDKALSTLGLTDGVFHMELFHTACGGIAFGECAARRGGGPIRDQVRYKFGVDLAYHGVRALLETCGTDTIPTSVVDGEVASAYLPLAHGTLLDHPSVEELLALPDVVSARIFAPKGLRTQGPAANTFGRMGEFTVHTARGEASARLDEVSRWFESRLRVLPLTPTMRELRALYS